MFLRGKKGMLSMVFVTLLLGFAGASSQTTQTPSVRFIMVGDEGGLASGDQKAVAAAMGKEAERIKARFVVTVGDNFHENGIASATDPRWKTEFEDVYSHPALQIPWYPSLGNHDYRGSVEGELGYSAFSTRWKFTSRYYVQNERIDDTTSLLIVHLDTSPLIKKYRLEPNVYCIAGQDAKKQLAWLDSVLTATRVRWTIVVGHHPVYSATPKGGNTEELIEELLPILKAHNIPLYVSAHQHFLQHLKHDAMDFVVSGGGADHGTDVHSREDVVFGASVLGFVSVVATAQNLQVSFLDTSSTILHTVKITAPLSR